MRVALIETASAAVPGSMRRYAELLMLAFEEHAEIELVRVPLDAPAWLPRALPRPCRSWGHHGAVAWNAWLLRKCDVDVFHIVDGSHAYIARWFPKGKTVATAHDVIPSLQMQGRFPVAVPGRAARWLIGQSLAGLSNVSEILASSERTARDLQAAGVCSMPLTHCPLALEPGLFAPAERSARIDSSHSVMLHVGNNGFYKNRSGVVETFARVRSELKCELVLAGPAPQSWLKQRIRDLGLESDVKFVVDPDDQVLRTLYREAHLFLFPSIYEGFGWPPLEAMASGCPVVCSDEGSLPEVVGKAALMAAAADVDALARHCVNVLTDVELAMDLRRRGLERAGEFGLDRFRLTVEAAYRRVANGTQFTEKADIVGSSGVECSG